MTGPRSPVIHQEGRLHATPLLGVSTFVSSGAALVQMLPCHPRLGSPREAEYGTG